MNREEKIVVLGGGESGVGASLLAKKKGYVVFLSDRGVLKETYRDELKQMGVDFEEGCHTLERILDSHLIIKSPGIPDTAPVIVQAKERGISIISEIEFAARYTDATKICITGSNGKTTTASLIYHILKSAGKDVVLTGNIGSSFAREVASNNREYFVIELSSFQLEGMFDFKAEIAILMNITPDHLDRYDYSMQKYVDAKMRICRNQTKEDAFIYWVGDDLIAQELLKNDIGASLYGFGEKDTQGAVGYVQNGKVCIRTKNNIFTMDEEILALSGLHNLYNSLASGIAGKLLDISDEDIRRSLSDFQGVAHRLEKVATVKGVVYINDSKATNVNSCWYALQSISSNIVLIIGGTDKGNDYSEIDELVKSKVKALVLLGKDNSKLRSFFEGKVKTIVDTHSMKSAVEAAYKRADKDDTVLLSPCCASFDLFENYEDRGNQFKECVREL